MKKLLITAVLVSAVFSGASAQDNKALMIEKEVKADINRAAGMFYARYTAKAPKDTPAPKGKKPFYINHYGCPGPYYLDKSIGHIRGTNNLCQDKSYLLFLDNEHLL